MHAVNRHFLFTFTADISMTPVEEYVQFWGSWLMYSWDTWTKKKNFIESPGWSIWFWVSIWLKLFNQMEFQNFGWKYWGKVLSFVWHEWGNLVNNSQICLQTRKWKYTWEWIAHQGSGAEELWKRARKLVEQNKTHSKQGFLQNSRQLNWPISSFFILVKIIWGRFPVGYKQRSLP